MKTSRKIGCGLIGFLICGLIYTLYYFTFTHWIPAGYVGVIYNAQGGLQNKVYKPQAVTLNWLQQLYLYPTKIQNAVYTQDSSAGEIKAADGISVTTSDNANTTFDISVIYRVQPEDVFTVFRSFGPIPIEDIQSQHIRRAVKDGASAIGSQYDLFSLMGPKRQEASEKLTAELRGRLRAKGITVEQAMILTAYPSQDTAQKINSRVNSYIMLDISRLNQQIAEVSRQTSVIAAEALQKAQAITAAGTVAKSLDVIDLDIAEQAIKKWNGHLAPFPKDGKQTIVLSGSGLTVVPDKPQEDR